MHNHDSMWSLFLSEVDKQRNGETQNKDETVIDVSPKKMTRIASKMTQQMQKQAARKKVPKTITFERKPVDIDTQSYIKEDCTEIVKTIDELIEKSIKSKKVYEKGEVDQKSKAVESLNEFKALIADVNKNIVRYIDNLRSTDDAFLTEKMAYKKKTVEMLSRLIQSEVMMEVFRENLKLQKDSMGLKPLLEEVTETEEERARRLKDTAKRNKKLTTSELLSSRREHSIVDVSRDDIVEKREKIQARGTINREIINLYVDNLVRDFYENSNVSPLLPAFLPEESRNMKEKYREKIRESVAELSPVFETIVNVVEKNISELTEKSESLLDNYLKDLQTAKEEDTERPSIDLGSFFKWENIPTVSQGNPETYRKIVIDTYSPGLIDHLITQITEAVSNLTTAKNDKPFNTLVDSKVKNVYSEQSSIFGAKNIADIVINKITLIELSYNEEKKKKEERRSEPMMDALYGAIFNIPATSTVEKEQKIRGYLTEYANNKINSIEKDAIIKDSKDKFFEDLIVRALNTKVHTTLELNPVLDELLTQILISLKGRIRNRKQAFGMTLTGMGSDFRIQYGDDGKEAQNRLQNSFIQKEVSGKSSEKGFDKSRYTLPMGTKDRFKADTLSVLSKMFAGVPATIAGDLYNILGNNTAVTDLEESLSLIPSDERYNQLDELTKSVLYGKEIELGKYVASVIKLEDEKRIIEENPSLLDFPADKRDSKIKEIKEHRQSTRTKNVKKRDDLRLWFLNMGMSPAKEDIYDFSAGIQNMKKDLLSKNKEYTDRIQEIQESRNKIEKNPELAKTQKGLYLKELETLNRDFYETLTKKRMKALSDIQKLPENRKQTDISGVPLRSQMSSKEHEENISKLKAKYPLGVLAADVEAALTKDGSGISGLERLVEDSKRFEASLVLLENQETEFNSLNSQIGSSLEIEYVDPNQRFNKIVSLVRQFADEQMKNLNPKEILQEVLESIIDSHIIYGKSTNPSDFSINQSQSNPFIVISTGNEDIIGIYDLVSKQYLDETVDMDGEYNPKQIRNSVLDNPLEDMTIKLMRFFNGKEGNTGITSIISETLSSKYVDNINRWAFTYIASNVCDRIKQVRSDLNITGLKNRLLSEGLLASYLKKGVSIFSDILEEVGLVWEWTLSPDMSSPVNFVNTNLFGSKSSNVLVHDQTTNLVLYNAKHTGSVGESLYKTIDIPSEIATALMNSLTKVIKQKEASTTKIKDQQDFLKKMPLGEIAARLRGMSEKKDKLNAIQNLFKSQWDTLVGLIANKNKFEVETKTLEKLKYEDVIPTSKQRLFDGLEDFKEQKGKSLFYLGVLKKLSRELLDSLNEEMPDEEGNLIPLNEYIPGHLEGIENQSLALKLTENTGELISDINDEINELNTKSKYEEDTGRSDADDDSDIEGIPEDILRELGGFGPSVVDDENDDENDNMEEEYEDEDMRFIVDRVIQLFNKYVGMKALFEAGASQEAIFTLNDSWEGFLERVTQVIEAKDDTKGITKGIPVAEEEDSEQGLTDEEKELLDVGIGLTEERRRQLAQQTSAKKSPPVPKDTRPTAKGTTRRGRKSKVQTNLIPLNDVLSAADRRSLLAEEELMGLSLTLQTPKK